MVLPDGKCSAVGSQQPEMGGEESDGVVFMNGGGVI